MSDMWSQEEIDALLNASTSSDSPDSSDSSNLTLTQEEVDALGEIGNICMGTAATTMSTMMDRRVNITTPTVIIHSSISEMMSRYTRPYVAVQVTYTEGLMGNNILLLKEQDSLMITNVLLSGETTVPDGAVLGELEMSCMNEIMNQMVGSSATAMSNLLHQTVNISPPLSLLCNVNEDPTVRGFLVDNTPIVRINFDMEIEGVLKSEIMQIFPMDFGKDLVAILTQENIRGQEEAERIKAQRAEAASTPVAAPAPVAPPPQPQQAAPPLQAAPQYQQPAPPPRQRVDVQPLQYQAFDEPEYTPSASHENMDIVIDVPLQVTVELGKARKSIKEILDLGKGSIVVLEKQAGEMVEVQVNGKLIARGEVVVIDDNYGVRITELYSAGKRIG